LAAGMLAVMNRTCLTGILKEVFLKDSDAVKNPVFAGLAAFVIAGRVAATLGPVAERVSG